MSELEELRSLIITLTTQEVELVVKGLRIVKDLTLLTREERTTVENLLKRFQDK